MHMALFYMCDFLLKSPYPLVDTRALLNEGYADKL